MGRNLLPPEDVRTTIKFRAKKKILDALTPWAIAEKLPREHLIERIVTDAVEARAKRADKPKRRRARA